MEFGYDEITGRKYVTLGITGYELRGSVSLKAFGKELPIKTEMLDTRIKLNSDQLQKMKDNATVRSEHLDKVSRGEASMEDMPKMQSHLPTDQEIVLAINDGGTGAEEIVGAEVELYEVYEDNALVPHSKYRLEAGKLVMLEKVGQDCHDEKGITPEDREDTVNIVEWEE